MDAYVCAIWGFLRICWPNRSVLKIGFRTPDELPSPLSWFFEELAAADFMEDGCVFEKRSDVARGISAVLKLFQVGVSNIQGCLF